MEADDGRRTVWRRTGGYRTKNKNPTQRCGEIYCICSVNVNQQIMFTSKDISLNLYVSTCGRTSRGWMVQHRWLSCAASSASSSPTNYPDSCDRTPCTIGHSDRCPDCRNTEHSRPHNATPACSRSPFLSWSLHFRVEGEEAWGKSSTQLW